MYITAAEVRQALPDRVLLDVRTPAEYEAGHIVGARNLPLFSNAERAEVGTLYKQTGPDQAFLRGLDFAGARMRWYVERARELAPERRVLLHCWRGGQRSGSLGWLLQQAGFDVRILRGGYKAYRTYLHEQVGTFPQPILVLGGHTGSGKTRILHALAARGATVLDLEALARHKGSAFGALGEAEQPTVEQFENDLFAALEKLPHDQPVWMENESRSIGRVYLPQPFWARLQAAPLLHLEMPLDWRVQNLVEDYADFPPEELSLAFQRITKRLGGQHVKAAVAAIEAGDFATAARIALHYYDKAYDVMLERRGDAAIYRLAIESRNPEDIAARAAAWAEEYAAG